MPLLSPRSVTADMFERGSHTRCRHSMRWHFFALIHHGRFVSADCLIGSIIISIPNAADNDVGDQTTIGGTISVIRS